MTFTIDFANPDYITDIRFEVRDTDEASALFSDEEITYVYNKKGSVNLAVIALIEAKIGELANEENFKADWLQVDNRSKLDQLRALLQLKKAEYGLNSGSTGVVHRFRADSLQDEEPTYDDDSYRDSYDDGLYY